MLWNSVSLDVCVNQIRVSNIMEKGSWCVSMYRISGCHDWYYMCLLYGFLKWGKVQIIWKTSGFSVKKVCQLQGPSIGHADNGRFFLHRILNSINKLNKLCISASSQLSLWTIYNGGWNICIHSMNQCTTVVIHTDTCNERAGMFVNGEWHYVNWNTNFLQADILHINNKVGSYSGC